MIDKISGDWDTGFLTVLSLDKESKTAWASGLEIFLNTAEEDALGAGSTSLDPQVFWVKFLPTGLFATTLQYKFGIGADRPTEGSIEFGYKMVGW